MARYYHAYPPIPKHKKGYFHKLFTEEESAKLAYNRDMAFRKFVNEWNADVPELMTWSLADFYRAYKNQQPLQLSLALA